jgi:hypothetical protein
METRMPGNRNICISFIGALIVGPPGGPRSAYKLYQVKKEPERPCRSMRRPEPD